MRLLLDEMIGPRVAEALRERGIDVVALVDNADLRGLPDAAVLERALEDERILVTRNLGDFARLDQQWQAAGRRHRGLVLLTERAFPQNRNLVDALVQALGHASERAILPAPGEVLYLRSPRPES